MRAVVGWQRTEPGLRVVLKATKPGAWIGEHAAHGQVTVQVVAGRLRIHPTDHTVELFGGSLLSVESNVAHDLEALKATACLLTIAGARPASAG